MSIVAEYTIDPPSYAAVMCDVSEIQLSIEQIAACDPETVSVTFWAASDDLDAFEAGLERVEAVTDIEPLSERRDGRRLYQIRLPATETTYWEWAGRGGVLLECTGTHDGLALRMRFPGREALVAYRRYCDERDVPFDLLGLHSTNTHPEERHQMLTSGQDELLTAAVENGYFDVPRRTRLCDLADRFEISDQAASERLRRGLSNTLGNGTSARSSEPRIGVSVKR